MCACRIYVDHIVLCSALPFQLIGTHCGCTAPTAASLLLPQPGLARSRGSMLSNMLLPCSLSLQVPHLLGRRVLDLSCLPLL